MRAAAVVVAISGSSVATAQVCTESSPGVARVELAGGTATINLAAGSIPKVNGVSCGFAATSIDVIGSAGNDTVSLNYVPPTVLVTMQLGAGTDRVQIYLTNGNDAAAGTQGGFDRDSNGTTDVDLLQSTIAQVTVYARGGDDLVDCERAGYKVRLVGGAGNDILGGSLYDDSVDGGPGDDIISGGPGDDTLDGNTGNDLVYGGDGNDKLVAKASFDGNDVYYGGIGADTLAYGGRATPVKIALLDSTASEDTIADDVDTIRGGKGDDTIDFSNATLPKTLRGGPGNDTVRGGQAADEVYGEGGRDAVFGGGGRDAVIDGGAGDDTLGYARDGWAETVRCGAGVDAYIPNTEDTFVGCERAIADTGAKVAFNFGHVCAILASGVVKCWGRNAKGQLGHGTTIDRGGQVGDMGAALPVTDLGPGRIALAVSAGWAHTCALLDDGAIKCWGANDQGQLGLGDTATRGDEPGEMGDALPAIDLGPGRRAVAVSASGVNTCALLDDGSVRCWGNNVYGQLGQGDTATRGDQPGEMGDALPAIDLGRKAIAIESNRNHTCAVLDDGTAKCWGWGPLLGQGDTVSRGDEPGEMGNALPPIDLGPGRSVLALSLAQVSTCAILDDRSVKCWGYATSGQLGYGDLVQRGAAPGEMGAALPVVPIGSVAALASGSDRHCARFDDGTAKCWGDNLHGPLGQGDTWPRGDQPGVLAALPAIDLGAGRTVVALATGDGEAQCATLDDATVKCWGVNHLGQLGLEDTAHRGDQPGEMGDALPAVNLGSPIARMAVSSVADAAAPSDVVDGLEADVLEADADTDTLGTDAEALDADAEALDADARDGDAGMDEGVGCSAAGGSVNATFALVLALGVARRRRRSSARWTIG